jgi:maltooligosyltrehalose trehalohydrolase
MGSDPLHLPQGAFRQPDGAVVWRVWAPHSEVVTLILSPSDHPVEVVMQPAGFGYFVHREERVAEGLRYCYRLADGRDYPDPASRWQPDGVHRPSAVFSLDEHVWSDADWRGVAREDLAIYELHVGTFTAEGTFDAIIPRLAELRELGITALEIMPVAQFSGERNWGYDGVHPYAVQASYGGPHGLQRLVAAAHGEGLGVILDVVYNHLGPEGNYLERFGPYFTDRYRTPWGYAVNFDGSESDAVRQFVIDNACTWVRDFHVDGLRLDAVHAIFDFSARHIVADIQAAVQNEATRQQRRVHVIAESDQNDTRIVHAPERGGFGLDGVWSDDFHHSVHALLTGEQDGYYQAFGRAEQLAKAYNDVFVYDGCYSPYRRQRHGSRVGDMDRGQFVVCVQNHDQVGNRAAGDRFGTLLPPAAQRLACTLLLLSPCTPLLFMGEEYGETRPFPFFCSFNDPELIEAVRRGRREEFASLAFRWQGEVPDPQSPATFAAAKLKWQWPEGSREAGTRRLYAALLAARRTWPPLRDRQQTRARVLPAKPGNAEAAQAILVLERGGSGGLLAIANLTGGSPPLPTIDARGLSPSAPVFSSEDIRFGGSRLLAEPMPTMSPYEVLIFDHSGSRP